MKYTINPFKQLLVGPFFYGSSRCVLQVPVCHSSPFPSRPPWYSCHTQSLPRSQCNRLDACPHRCRNKKAGGLGIEIVHRKKTNTTVSLHQNNTVTEKTIVRFVYISHCLLSFKGSCKSTNTDGTKNKEHPDQFMHIYIYTYIYTHVYIYIYIYPMDPNIAWEGA